MAIKQNSKGRTGLLSWLIMCLLASRNQAVDVREQNIQKQQKQETLEAHGRSLLATSDSASAVLSHGELTMPTIQPSRYEKW